MPLGRDLQLEALSPPGFLATLFSPGTPILPVRDEITRFLAFERGMVGKIQVMQVGNLCRRGTFDVGAYETEGQAGNPGWRIVAGFKPLTTPEAPLTKRSFPLEHRCDCSSLAELNKWKPNP
jgi:hypothetical protein